MPASLKKPRIGFIGLGNMGLPMARNLLGAGYPLAVHNRTIAKCEPLVAAGAIAPGSARGVGEQSDVTITIVRSYDEVNDALFGADGLMGGLRPGCIHISMETLSPDQARELAARLASKGVASLDAPVSGGPKGAADASLSIMAGGPQATFDAVFPVLKTMGAKVLRIGEAGAGQVTKACNQLIVAVTIEAVAEALALAKAFGADQRLVREVMLGGYATSRILELHALRMIEGDFRGGGAVRSHLKDRATIYAAAEAAQLDLPAARAAFDRVKRLVDSGGGELDHSALYTLLDSDAARLVRS